MGLPLLFSGAMGCGPSGPQRHAVSGRVTVDGQPLVDGDIRFIPSGSTQAPTASAIIADGDYAIPEQRGLMAGSYLVSIEAERKTGRKIKADMVGSATTDLYEQYLPARYNDKTELTAEIAESRDDLDFELTLKK